MVVRPTTSGAPDNRPMGFVDSLLVASARAITERWRAITLAHPGLGPVLAHTTLAISVVGLLASSSVLGRCIALVLVRLAQAVLWGFQRVYLGFATLGAGAQARMNHAGLRGAAGPAPHPPRPLSPPSRPFPGYPSPVSDLTARLTGLTSWDVGLPPSPWTYGLTPQVSRLEILKTRPDILRARRGGALRQLGEVGGEVARATAAARRGAGRITAYEVDGRVVSWLRRVFR